jgi:deoxyadenosine/deoxycytidine kinase
MNAPKVDAIVYLRTDPEICHERLVKRNRGEESSVSLDYLRTIHDRHEEWIGERRLAPLDTPVFVIDNTAPLTRERTLEIKS